MAVGNQAPAAHWFIPPPLPPRAVLLAATDAAAPATVLIRLPTPVESDLKLFSHSPTLSRASSNRSRSGTWSEEEMVRIASASDFGSDYTITDGTMDITSAGRRPSFFDLFVSSSPPRSPIPWGAPNQEPWLRALAEIAMRICPGCEPSEVQSPAAPRRKRRPSVHDAAVFQVEAAQKKCAESSLHEKLYTIGGPITPPEFQHVMAPIAPNVMPDILVATDRDLRRPTAMAA